MHQAGQRDKQKMSHQQKKKTVSGINEYLAVITFNVNGLNSTFKIVTVGQKTKINSLLHSRNII